MPKATISFNLPQEAEEFKDAVNVQDYKDLLHSVEQDVFRPARKHGYPNKKIQSLIEALDRLVEAKDKENLDISHPNDEYGYLDATDLIALLEQEYYNSKTFILDQE